MARGGVLLHPNRHSTFSQHTPRTLTDTCAHATFTRLYGWPGSPRPTGLNAPPGRRVAEAALAWRPLSITLRTFNQRACGIGQSIVDPQGDVAHDVRIVTSVVCTSLGWDQARLVLLPVRGVGSSLHSFSTLPHHTMPSNLDSSQLVGL